ncbi:MAG: hypothetical protein NT128_03230 [Proteobacteria bacterium]|nr:hypothetical protein [Pseudomonadota bacterium]
MNLRFIFLCCSIYFGLSLVYGSSECAKVLADELLGSNPLPSCHAKSTYLLDKPLVILGCNGGGIKGYISARVLEELEKAVGSAEKPFPIYQMIHGSIGSSTGTIISAAITIDPKYWSSQTPSILNSNPSIPNTLVQLYLKEGPCIFSNVSPSSCLYGLQNSCIGGLCMQLKNIFKPKYNGKHLSEVFNKYFGDLSLVETRKISASCSSCEKHPDDKIELAMLTCNMHTGRSFEFNSKKASKGEASNFFLRDAVYASCVQSTTFPTARINPIVGNKEYDKTRAFNLIDQGPLDNPVFKALEMGLRQLEERGISPMKYFHDHYSDYQAGKSVKPLLRIVHISTGHHTTRLLPVSQFHNAGILKLVPTLITTLLENQGVYASEAVQFFAKMLPFIEFYNLEGETSVSALEDDKANDEIFRELERVANDITTGNKDFIRLAKDLRDDCKM